jgi:hypothetical protein
LLDDLTDSPQDVTHSEKASKTPLPDTVRELTHDGRDVVRFLISVMKGRIKEARVADRMKAAVELLDRGFGRPKLTSFSSDDADEAGTGPPISLLGGQGVWPTEVDEDG